MLKNLKSFFGKDPVSAKPAVPAGTRWYLVGDIHGRNDLFKALKAAIDEDDAASGSAETTVVLLGDLIDRGSDSAGVIKAARKWGKQRAVRYLAGNHEEMFLDSFESAEVLRHFVKHGGRETLLSYGITRKDYNQLTIDELHAKLIEIVPAKDRKFLAGFEEMITAGDYAFVHAGINPERAIDDQERKDLLWIRDRFLSHKEPHPLFVVHGHTIQEEVDERKNRIGIDTGAFRTGRLTALVLEGTDRRYIYAAEKKNGIRIEHAAKA